MSALKTRVRLILTWVAAVGCILWIAHVLWQRWGELPAVDPTWWAIVLAMLLAGCVVIVNSVIVEISARCIDCGVGFARAQGVGFLVTLANYFLPFRMGLAFRVAFYVRHTQADPIRLAMVLAAGALVVQAVSVVVLISVLGFKLGENYLFLAAGSLVIAAICLPRVATRIKVNSRLRVGRTISMVINGFSAMWKNGGVAVGAVAGWSFFGLVLTAVRYRLEMSMLPEALPMSMLMALAAAAGLSSLIAVTFGGLGIKEAAMVVVARLLGVPLEIGLTIALIDRVIVSGALALFALPAMSFARGQE